MVLWGSDRDTLLIGNILARMYKRALSWTTHVTLVEEMVKFFFLLYNFCFWGLLLQMWCARYGHLECGVILAQWSPECLEKRDSNALNPVQIAAARGFLKFASELEKIQTTAAAPSFKLHLDNEDFSMSKLLAKRSVKVFWCAPICRLNSIPLILQLGWKIFPIHIHNSSSSPFVIQSWQPFQKGIKSFLWLFPSFIIRLNLNGWLHLLTDQLIPWYNGFHFNSLGAICASEQYCFQIESIPVS